MIMVNVVLIVIIAYIDTEGYLVSAHNLTLFDS